MNAARRAEIKAAIRKIAAENGGCMTPADAARLALQAEVLSRSEMEAIAIAGIVEDRARRDPEVLDRLRPADCAMVQRILEAPDEAAAEAARDEFLAFLLADELLE